MDQKQHRPLDGTDTDTGSTVTEVPDVHRDLETSDFCPTKFTCNHGLRHGVTRWGPLATRSGFIPSYIHLQPWFNRACWGRNYLTTRGAPSCTLQGINIFPPKGKFGKSSTQNAIFGGDMLVPWRVYQSRINGLIKGLSTYIYILDIWISSWGLPKKKEHLLKLYDSGPVKLQMKEYPTPISIGIHA